MDAEYQVALSNRGRFLNSYVLHIGVFFSYGFVQNVIAKYEILFR